MQSPFAVGLALATLSSLSAQTIQAPFNALYTITNIGAIPGLTGNYGAITFDRDDPNLLLCTSWDTVGVQNLYSIPVVRDAQGHVTGFTGTLTPRAQADYIDGGLDYHPSGVLFYTRYAGSTGVNAIGQFRPGSTVPDRTNTLIGPNYIGGLAIVPSGLPGAGHLKTLRWPGGQWTDAQLAPDGNGTFDVVGEAQTATLAGGPDGFAYVPHAAPLFTGGDVMVAEFNASVLATYSIDAQGDPIVATRQVFANGFTSAFVLTVDPVTLDIVHAGWSGTTVHVIKGFNLACGQCSNYGTGLAGTGGLVPRIMWLGCPLGGETTGLNVSQGQPLGLGVIAVGFTQQSIPVFGGTLLNEAAILLTSFLSPTGTYTLPLAIPTGLSSSTLYFQAAYLDAAAVQGFSLSNGLQMQVL
ncbi:MAG TPA: hypothetical protein VFZ65_20395 [Planctomycetota bacterium]|nr:hypothetical protein [Planctomycetota bacterium]